MDDDQHSESEVPEPATSPASETPVDPATQQTEHITEPVPDVEQPASHQNWEQRYYRERTLTRIFMATTAAAVLLFTGTLAYAIASDPVTDRPGSPSERYRGDGDRFERGGPGRPGGRDGGGSRQRDGAGAGPALPGNDTQV